MKSLLAKIKAHYDGQGMNKRAKLYLGLAPQWPASAASSPKQQPPFITFNLISGVQSGRSLDGKVLDEPLIQFSIWSAKESAIEAVELFDGLTGIFDHFQEQLSDSVILKAERQSYSLAPDQDGGWHYQVDYRFTTERLS